MSQLYYNDITTDLASCNTTNEKINYLRRIRDESLTDEEWQDILTDTAEACNTTIDIILSCFELPDDTNFEKYIADETVEYPEEKQHMIYIVTIEERDEDGNIIDSSPEFSTSDRSIAIERAIKIRENNPTTVIETWNDDETKLIETTLENEY